MAEPTTGQILLRLAALLCGLAMLLEIIYNLIVLPASKKQLLAGREAFLNTSTFRHIFRTRRPRTLRRRPFLSFMVERGSTLLFAAGAMLAAAYAYLETGNWLWVVAVGAIMVPVYFIAGLLALLVAVLMLREGGGDPDQHES